MMKNNLNQSSRPSIGKILLRYSAIYLWSGILLFAMFNGYLIHALGAMIITVIALFLDMKKNHARSENYNKVNAGSLSSYHPGEDYLQVFSPKNRVI